MPKSNKDVQYDYDARPIDLDYLKRRSRENCAHCCNFVHSGSSNLGWSKRIKQLDLDHKPKHSSAGPFRSEILIDGNPLNPVVCVVTRILVHDKTGDTRKYPGSVRMSAEAVRVALNKIVSSIEPELRSVGLRLSCSQRRRA